MLSNVIIKRLLEGKRGIDLTQTSGEEAWRALVRLQGGTLLQGKESWHTD